LLTSDTTFGLAISTACPANYVDTLAPALLHVYGARGLTVKFVKNLVEHEISRTGNIMIWSVAHSPDGHSVLFRGNNAAPRIITTFLHTQADTYLADILGPVLRKAIRDPHLQEFSTGSSLPREEREANLRYIQVVAKEFLDAIVNSGDALPLCILSPYQELIFKGLERDIPSYRCLCSDSLSRQRDSTPYGSWKYRLFTLHRPCYLYSLTLHVTK
jgi:hypothetical protein